MSTCKVITHKLGNQEIPNNLKRLGKWHQANKPYAYLGIGYIDASLAILQVFMLTMKAVVTASGKFIFTLHRSFKIANH